MVEVVGSIPIAPTRSLPFAFLRALRAPGPFLALALPLFALRASRRERGHRALDANIHCAPPRTLGFPGHQPSPTGTEAARLMAVSNRDSFSMLYLAWVAVGCRRRRRGQITRPPTVSPPVCLTFVGVQVPWGGGEEARQKAELCEVRQVSRSGAGVYNFLIGFRGNHISRGRDGIAVTRFCKTCVAECFRGTSCRHEPGEI